MATETIDPAKTEAFAGQMVGVLNNAFLGLLLSVGHQTGLFDTMSRLPAATSADIARAAGLKERYVREWLGGMTAGHVVEYERAGRTYRLPPEHAAVLTRAAGPGNLGRYMQYISVFGDVEQDVVACFRNGGGAPYAAYPRFQQLQAEEHDPIHDAALVETTLPLAPGLVERLREGADVLDIGCGRGHAINIMARAYPKSRFTGYDLSGEAMVAASTEAADLGLSNAQFAVKDVATLEATDAYDLIVAFDVIHDLAQPERVLQAVARALRPDGTFLMIDIAASSDVADNTTHPVGPLLYGASVFHCMTVSLGQSGPGLGTMWGEQTAHRMLEDAGFAVDIKRVPGDILNNYYIARKR